MTAKYFLVMCEIQMNKELLRRNNFYIKVYTKKVLNFQSEFEQIDDGRVVLI